MAVVVDRIIAVQRTGLYRLVLSDGEKLDIDIAALTDYSLTRGYELTAEQIDSLRSKAAYLHWTTRCLRKLARRPQSKAELIQFMQANKVEARTQADVIDYLTAHKYLNDAAFAEWLVKSGRRKQKSTVALRYELAQKGIAKDLIAKVLTSANNSDETTIKNIINKKRSQSRYADDTKLKHYLARKGFGYDLIQRALSDKD
jgi:regulatory protein